MALYKPYRVFYVQLWKDGKKYVKFKQIYEE